MASWIRHSANFTLCSPSFNRHVEDTEKHIQSLSGFQPVHYDCCPSLCICYTGTYETLLKCLKCKTDQYKADGTTPWAYFLYLPIIPWICAMVTNSPFARKMWYRANHQHDPTKVTDIFNSAYCSLLWESFVTVGGEELPNWFFSDPCDIALGLSTDGFGPFKHHTKTTWPIILIQLQSPSWGAISEEELYFSWHNSWTKEAWWFRFIPLAASPENFYSWSWVSLHPMPSQRLFSFFVHI